VKEENEMFIRVHPFPYPCSSVFLLEPSKMKWLSQGLKMMNTDILG